MVNGQVNFWDSGVWSFVVVLAVLFGAMLLANALRRAIKPLIRQSDRCWSVERCPCGTWSVHWTHFVSSE